MVWNINDSCGFESSKIASLAVPYLQGTFLDLGCGNAPVWPSGIGVDNYTTFANTSGIKCDIADLSLFADRSVDAVFSSHALEDFERKDVPAILAEWARVIRRGGYMVLYVPSANLYPKVGQKGANPAHKWDIYPGDIEAILKGDEMQGTEYGWELVESEERGGTNEYSLYVVVRKTAECGWTENVECQWTENVWQRNPDGKKRLLVVRYGAIGDAIQASSIFPLLQAQGWHVTLNCKQSTKEVLLHDPNIDEFLCQSDDFVPNSELGVYWASLEERYDKIINLCEATEGALLQLPGRMGHAYSTEVRQYLFGNTGYLERIHDIAEVTHDHAPKFYSSDYEKRWAKALKKAWTGDGQPVILMALAGSSTHKIYPHISTVIQWLLQRTTAIVVMTGDKGVGGALQAAIMDGLKAADFNMDRVRGMAGKWSIRETLAFAQVADVAFGPETGVLNSVSFEPDVAKVLMLSHSSRINIGGDWLNTITLEPTPGSAPCFPCHRLHSSWEFCHRSEETMAALCATGIRPEAAFSAIMKSLAAKVCS